MCILMLYAALRVTLFLQSLVPSNVLTITKACLVDNSVSVQWMVSEAVNIHVYSMIFIPGSLLAPVVIDCVGGYRTTHL